MTRVMTPRYRCDFCGRSKASARSAREHESHCFKNANRVPYSGELSEREYRPSGPDDDDWPDDEEWEWPGAGKIFKDGAWVDLPACDIKALHKMKPRERIAVLWPYVPTEQDDSPIEF